LAILCLRVTQAQTECLGAAPRIKWKLNGKRSHGAPVSKLSKKRIRNYRRGVSGTQGEEGRPRAGWRSTRRRAAVTRRLCTPEEEEEEDPSPPNALTSGERCCSKRHGICRMLLKSHGGPRRPRLVWSRRRRRSATARPVPSKFNLTTDTHE
jgi:hypothetical protein